VYNVLKQEVLYPPSLVRQIASLNTVVTVVLIAHAVKLAALPAVLLKKAVDGYTTKVLSIVTPVRNL
jgi:hypothetical protein